MGLRTTSVGPRALNDANGAAMTAKQYTADIDSDWIGVGGARWVTFWFDGTRTGGTVDIDVECTYDNGTTVFDMPTAINSQTKASFTQITATGKHMKTFELPAVADDPDFKIRLELTLATTPDWVITCKYSLRRE